MIGLSPTPAGRAGTAADDEIVRWGVLGFALVDLGTALFMAVAPHAFFTSIGPFGPFNPHYLRDVATFQAAFAAGLAVAAARPAWRVPMLGASAVQYGLHAVNHLLDIADAHPAWTGYADFGSLLAATLALLWLLRRAAAEPAGRCGGLA